MGEILATFAYLSAPKFNLPRQYVKGVAFGWVAGWTITIDTNPYLLLEHTFGGYQVYCKFKANWYQWTSNNYTMDYPIEDLYAIEPGTGTHVSVGTVTIGIGFNSENPSYHYTLAFFAPPAYQLFTIPASPPGFWLGALP